MANFKPMIGIYIPSVTYTSVGPGFVDAIKLEARNLYLPEKKYKVYTEYISTSSTPIESSFIYRYVIGSRVDASNLNSVTSVLYSDDTLRCPHGYFYDYISADPNNSDGGLDHVLTCFSDVNKLNGLQSFSAIARDGLYVVETDEADAAIELLFTFYTLSYDKYDDTDPTKPVDPLKVFACPDDYIEIGAITKIVRASTIDKQMEADLAFEKELNMYYDISKKASFGDEELTLYLPINGHFKPIIGLESDSPTELECGEDIFSPYSTVSEISSSTDWGNPIVISVGNEALSLKTEVVDRGYLSAYVPKKTKYMLNEAHTDSQREYFSPPTLVDISLQSAKSSEITADLLLHDLQVDAALFLWINTPSFAILNLTYKTTLLNSDSTYAPAAILDYLPSLGYINYPVKNITQADTLWGSDTGPTIDVASGEQSLQHFVYTGTSCAVGRVLSFTLDKIPNQKFNIINYCNNFLFSRDSESEYASCFFVHRPSYVVNGLDADKGIYNHSTSDFVQEDKYKGSLISDGYRIDSTTQFNAIHDYTTCQSEAAFVYPLNKYFTEVDIPSESDWSHSYSPIVTLKAFRVPADHNPEEIDRCTSVIKSNFSVDKSVYWHVLTTSDLQNIPNILGESKQYTSNATVSLGNLYTETTVPVMDINKRWAYGDIYVDTGNMIIPWRSNKLPSHRFYPGNDYPRMVEWAKGFGILEMSELTGTSPVRKEVEDHDQIIVLSPMLAVDMDESTTTFSNKGDYKVIPAYYYGNISEPKSVLTDYKHQAINVSLVPDREYTIRYTSTGHSSTPTSTFIDYNEHKTYTLMTGTSAPATSTLQVEIALNDLSESGLYVLKFNKFFKSLNRPGLKSDRLKLKYTNLKSNNTFTANYNYIVILVNDAKSLTESLKLQFSAQGEGLIVMSECKLYKVDITDNKNLNQVLLKYWYDQAILSELGSKPFELVPDDDSNSFYHLLYDNIVFPSAVCAYENFRLFPDKYGRTKFGFTKQYSAVYLPKNPIYNIIGLYDIKNMLIIEIEDTPSDVKIQDLICYNQPSRYV